MRCHEAEGLLAPQLSDSLDTATQRELALHLDSCAACRARLQQEYELDRLITSAVNSAVPATGPVLNRVRQVLDGKRGRMRMSLAWRWPAIAAAMTLVLLSGVAISRFSASNPIHLLCEDAVLDHKTEVVERAPLQWRTSPAEIIELARRVVPNPQLPPSVAGLALKRARICGLQNAAALHLVYGNGSQEISVFLMLARDLPPGSLPGRPAITHPLHRENDLGIPVASFAANGLGVVVVGGSKDLTQNVADQLVRTL